MQRLVILLALASAPLTWSQSSTSSSAHSEHNHGPAAQHTDHVQSMCKQMMGEHVSEIKAISQTLATNLAQMKSTLPLINDINERSRWQSNIVMWQTLADHFSEMAKHGEHMKGMGMGCGMMKGDSKSERTEHEDVHSPTPANPQ